MSAISWREQVNFQWDDDEVLFVLDQHTDKIEVFVEIQELNRFSLNFYFSLWQMARGYEKNWNVCWNTRTKSSRRLCPCRDSATTRCSFSGRVSVATGKYLYGLRNRIGCVMVSVLTSSMVDLGSCHVTFHSSLTVQSYGHHDHIIVGFTTTCAINAYHY